MFLPMARSRSHRRRLVGRYTRRVLGSGPVAYWPLTEGAGTVAHCHVAPAQDGTYSSDVGAMGVGIGPFGETVPYFDGANDYVDLFSGTFDGAFNGATGSMMIWARVSGVGVWTDGTTRYAFRLYDDADNHYMLFRPVNNSVIERLARAGGGEIGFVYGTADELGWMHLGLTWSDANNADQAYAYYNGIQSGPNAALNAWGGGGLDATQTIVGASSTLPGAVWSGWLAHAAVWDRVLSHAEFQALAAR